MRVIDANELYRVKFHGYPGIEITPSDVNAEAYKRGWNDAIDAVAECAPTVDAVEVVRCKDCKHRPAFRDDGRYVEGPRYQETLKNGLTVTLEDTRCPCVNGLDSYFSYVPKDDWFCANGERRVTDGDDQ